MDLIEKKQPTSQPGCPKHASGTCPWSNVLPSVLTSLTHKPFIIDESFCSKAASIPFPILTSGIQVLKSFTGPKLSTVDSVDSSALRAFAFWEDPASPALVFLLEPTLPIGCHTVAVAFATNTRLSQEQTFSSSRHAIALTRCWQKKTPRSIGPNSQVFSERHRRSLRVRQTWDLAKTAKNTTTCYKKTHCKKQRCCP